MEEQPQPSENPPSYAEIARHVPYNPAWGEDGGGKMDPKQPQYTWADPNVHAYPPVEQSQYPPPPGPGPYRPAYGQPMLSYYGQAGYGTPYCPSQQPQQQVMVIGGQHHQPVLIEHVQSFAGHIVLSCVVTFCCNFIVGFIAFVLAIVASSIAVADPKCARQLGHASLGVSIAGILLSVFIVCVMFGVVFTGADDDKGRKGH